MSLTWALFIIGAVIAVISFAAANLGDESTNKSKQGDEIAGWVGVIGAVLAVICLITGVTHAIQGHYSHEKRIDAQAYDDLTQHSLGSQGRTKFQVIKVDVSDDPSWDDVNRPMMLRESGSVCDSFTCDDGDENFAVIGNGPCYAKVSVYPMGKGQSGDGRDVVYTLLPGTAKIQQSDDGDDDADDAKKSVAVNRACPKDDPGELDEYFGIIDEDSGWTEPAKTQSPAPSASVPPVPVPTR